MYWVIEKTKQLSSKSEDHTKRFTSLMVCIIDEAAEVLKRQTISSQ